MNVIFLFCQIFLTMFQNTENNLEKHHTNLTRIELAGPIANYKAEISGLDWHENYLVLMCENPESFALGNWFIISKDSICSYLSNEKHNPLTSEKIKVIQNYSEMLTGYEGFEGLAFSHDTIYALIECNVKGQMQAWLVCGKIDLSKSRIVFDNLLKAKIPIPANLHNISTESVLIVNNEIIVIYEANGKRVNSQPVAYRFSKKLNYLGSIPMPHIEYRITDASRLDSTGLFWVTNYFYPKDWQLLKPPKTTATSDQSIERILSLKYSPDGIQIINETKPIPILSGFYRNWEGLVKFDDGFLIITDEFPRELGTILAFLKSTPDGS